MLNGLGMRRLIYMGVCKGEIVLLLVGAIIGFISSVGILIVERFLNKKGKLSIYYRFSNQKR